MRLKSLARYIPWICVTRGGESGKETSWSSDIEELEQMDAPKIYAKRLNEKEVLTHMSGEKFIFQIADGTVKLSGGDQVLRTSTLIRDRPDRGEELGNLQRESDGSSSTPLRDSSLYDGEAKSDFCLSQEMSFTVNTRNPESNCTCREKHHSLFHWNLSTWPGLLIHPWM